VKIKVYVVDLEIPARVKRWGLRIGIPAALVVGAGALAYASVPKTWNSNDVLLASDLNNDFAALDRKARFVGSTDAGVSYSVGFTTYCGSTTQTTPSLGGYVLTKAACQSACGGSGSAHLCSTEETLRSVEVGLSVPSGWVQQGDPIASGSYQIQDCEGFQTAQAASYGAYWAALPAGEMSISPCSTAMSALCCD
jgi:hypothetical protein